MDRMLYLSTTFTIIITVLAITANCERLWNAALCKPTNMSSMFEQYTSDLAVDGNKNGIMEEFSCAHTDSSSERAWWMVDLMDEYLVRRVVITNREMCSSRFRNVSINLYGSDPRIEANFPENTDGISCAMVTTSFEGTKSFECSSPSYARFVKLLKTEDLDSLNFCEVEVIVSKRRGESDSSTGLISRLFDVKRNTVVDDGQVVEVLPTSSAQSCLFLCARRGYDCNGFYWRQETGDCSILGVVDTRNVGELIVKEGTDFYAESPVKCRGHT